MAEGSMALPAPVLSSLERTAIATSIWGGCMGGVLLKALRSKAMHGANMFKAVAERRKHGRLVRLLCHLPKQCLHGEGCKELKGLIITERTGDMI